jgi:hypothetical protein
LPKVLATVHRQNQNEVFRTERGDPCTAQRYANTIAPKRLKVEAKAQVGRYNIPVEVDDETSRTAFKFALALVPEESVLLLTAQYI